MHVINALISLGPHGGLDEVFYDIFCLSDAIGVLVCCHGPLIDETGKRLLWVDHTFLLKRKEWDDEDR